MRNLGLRMSAALLTQLREHSTSSHTRDGRDVGFKECFEVLVFQKHSPEAENDPSRL